MMRAFALLPATLLVVSGLQAQDRLTVHRASGGPAEDIQVVAHQGFAAFEGRKLEGLGWVVEEDDRGFRATYPPDGPSVEIQTGSPFLKWGESGVHLAQIPYRESGRVHLPIQFLVDILPWKLPESFRYEPGSWVLEVLDAEVAPGLAEGEAPTQPFVQDPIRVVVIDAGHGGRDPGTMGNGGTREKDIVLAVARELARILGEEEKLEVHLTRDSDVLVPIWQRGELATEWKGSRHGVFISIHANALPSPGATRGFETYFLSEARTDHERRVAALENSAMELEEEEDRPQGDNPDLSHILTELRNLDHAHWSALLAENIQGQVDPIHPGRNRGVKQAPLAVITNSLMPAVLFEVGFLSNREEERLLNQGGFQKDVARSLARAILEFFRRYPPGGEWGGVPVP
jgi:N-acetylmuramoyl-L-alanine amidase